MLSELFSLFFHLFCTRHLYRSFNTGQKDISMRERNRNGALFTVAYRPLEMEEAVPFCNTSCAAVETRPLPSRK
jgi:hypothetical protein